MQCTFSLHSRSGLNKIEQIGHLRGINHKAARRNFPLNLPVFLTIDVVLKGAFMGYGISVATHVHQESRAPGRMEQELLTRLEVR